MKAVKLISPLVALLLITVFFAGGVTITAATNVTTNSTLTGDPTTTPSASQAATVGAGTITTSISASADKQNVAATEQFNITGKLRDSSNVGIPNQTVNLDRWNGVTYVYTGVRNITDEFGNYKLIRSESVAGTYNYSSNFTGFASYNASHSFPDVIVTVADRLPTKITLVVDHPNPFSGETFNFTGLLTNVTSGIPDVRVDLQSSLDNKTWSSASAPTKTANGTASGTFGFAGAITGNGTVYFRAYYSGNFTYKPAVSPTVVVNVLKPATNMADFQVNNANPITNQAFYFAGYLKTNATATNPSKALAGQLVYLEVSGEGVYWQQVSDPFVTDDTGLFAFTGALSTNGTFYFRAHFFGTDDALASVSPTVTVKVTSSSATLPSELSILASPPNPIEGQRVFIYGVVRSKETYPVAFSNAEVYLYWSSDGNNWSLASTSPAVTNASGVYAFAGSLSKGTYYFRTYYDGDAKYQAAYSPTLPVVCTGAQPTTLSLIADNVALAVGQTTNFTATLKNGATPLPYKNVTIYHYFNNVRSDDTTKTTDTNGNITLSKSLSSAGQYSYYATFAGDDTFESSTSSVVNVNVQGGWAGWSTIGGQLASGTGPAVCAPDANSLDVFVRGTDNALYYTHYSGSGWSSWTSLGGVLTSSPAAVSRPNGKIDVFVRATDNALWTRATTNGGTSWSGWSKIGGQLLGGTSPAAYAWGDTRIGWMVTGTDNAVWHMWKDSAGTHGWQSLGGPLTSSPAATSPMSGVIDVFGRVSNGVAYQREYSNNAWSSSWTSIGGQIASGTGPAACSWGSGRLDVFVQGLDGTIWHRSYNGAWSDWQSIGGAASSSPAATSRSSGTIDVFVRGSGGDVMWKYISNAG